MLRSLLFVSFRGCYYLYKLTPDPDAYVNPRDSLNEERFYTWVHAFHRAFKVTSKADQSDITLRHLEEYCDNEKECECVYSFER